MWAFLDVVFNISYKMKYTVMGRRHILIMKEQSSFQEKFPLPLFPLSFICCYLICTELELTFKGSFLSGE